MRTSEILGLSATFRLSGVLRLAGVAALLAGLPAQAQVGIWTVPTSPGFQSIRITGLSDGAQAAGSNLDNGGISSQTFTWSLAGGKQDFFRNGDPWLIGSSRISGDAQYVAGERARVRLSDGAIDDIQAPSGRPMTRLLAISGDGSKLMGEAADSTGFSTVTWTWTPQSGTQVLPQTPGFFGLQNPSDMSRDGSTIVGLFTAGESRGFVWREGQGYMIPKDIDGTDSLIIRCVNRDGSVYAGESTSVAGAATRWVNDVPSLITSISGYRMVPEGMSNDGNVIVGNLRQINGDDDRSFVWTPSTGTMFVEDYLNANGVSIPGDAGVDRLVVSGDGLSFAGRRSNLGGSFVATVPAPAGTSLLCVGLACVRRRSR